MRRLGGVTSPTHGGRKDPADLARAVPVRDPLEENVTHEISLDSSLDAESESLSGCLNVTFRPGSLESSRDLVESQGFGVDIATDLVEGAIGVKGHLVATLEGPQFETGAGARTPEGRRGQHPVDGLTRLARDGGGRGRGGLGVPEVAGLDHVEGVVETHPIGDARWDLEFGDLVVVDVLEDLA